MMKVRFKHLQVAILALLLSACASVPDSLIDSPHVRLSNVQVVGLGFDSQTFLLSFDVANPNPFPLPIRHVGYGVRLDGRRFASGETASEFTVPANGTTSFAISVDLDLLQTAPQLLWLVRDGSRRDVSYELEGQFAVGIPLTPQINYRDTGNIRLSASVY